MVIKKLLFERSETLIAQTVVLADENDFCFLQTLSCSSRKWCHD